MRGVSPLISTVLLILIVLLLATTIGPWMLDLAKKTSTGINRDINQDLVCRQTSYDFDSDYGNSGVSWDFSSTNKTVSAKIVNTGMQNLYNFSFQLVFQTVEGSERILSYPYVNITQDTQKTASNPLKPGEEWVLEADVTGIGNNWTLSKVRVINAVCPKISISLNV